MEAAFPRRKTGKVGAEDNSDGTVMCSRGDKGVQKIPPKVGPPCRVVATWEFSSGHLGPQ